MNQAEYLCHSSGPWKKHKYFKKIGEGKNAVYKYAKDKSGATDRENWQKHKREADMYEDQVRSHQGQEDVSWHTPIDDKAKPGEIAQARGARQTEKEYKRQYDKTPLGKAESTIKKGQALIDKILNPPVKKTVTDTKTGKTRTPSAPKSKADTVTLKRR